MPKDYQLNIIIKLTTSLKLISFNICFLNCFLTINSHIFLFCRFRLYMELANLKWRKQSLENFWIESEPWALNLKLTKAFFNALSFHFIAFVFCFKSTYFNLGLKSIIVLIFLKVGLKFKLRDLLDFVLGWNWTRKISHFILML